MPDTTQDELRESLRLAIIILERDLLPTVTEARARVLRTEIDLMKIALSPLSHGA